MMRSHSRVGVRIPPARRRAGGAIVPPPAMKFCPSCGSLLATRFVEGRDRWVCDSCTAIHYRNPVPSTTCLIPTDSGIVIIKRRYDPGMGGWVGALGPASPGPAVGANADAQVFVEPEDGPAPLLTAINGAGKSIDLVMYLLTDRQIIGALENAERRGVRVRTLLEQHPFGQ